MWTVRGNGDQDLFDVPSHPAVRYGVIVPDFHPPEVLVSRLNPRGRVAPVWLPVVCLIAVSGCTASKSSDAASPAPSSSTPAASAAPSPKPTATPGQVQLAGGKPLRPVGLFGALTMTGSSGIALTFDDGPDPMYTPKFLDLLKQMRVKATFCVVGKRAIQQPDLLRRIVAEGHTLCNHSYYHDLALGQMTTAEMTKDLQDTNDAIHKAVPGYNVRYFRAPGGNFTQALVDVASSLGMRSLDWAVDPRDWDFATYGTGQAMVKHIVSVVQSQAKPGVIILSHDLSKPDTLAAYQQLIPWLLKGRDKLIPMPV
jgi:peptidoglycan/xylan/chitin deacetylase (PgdA/CDA1 family)